MDRFIRRWLGDGSCSSHDRCRWASGVCRWASGGVCRWASRWPNCGGVRHGRGCARRGLGAVARAEGSHRWSTCTKVEPRPALPERLRMTRRETSTQRRTETLEHIQFWQPANSNLTTHRKRAQIIGFYFGCCLFILLSGRGRKSVEGRGKTNFSGCKTSGQYLLHSVPLQCSLVERTDVGNVTPTVERLKCPQPLQPQPRTLKLCFMTSYASTRIQPPCTHSS